MAPPTARAQARHIIATTPFFAEVLGEGEIDALAKRAVAVEVNSGSNLMQEDELGSSMFIVLSGQVDVITGGGSSTRKIARLGPRRFRRRDVADDRRAPERHGDRGDDGAGGRGQQGSAGADPRRSPELVDRFAAILRKRQTELDRAYGGRRGILRDANFADLIRSFFGGSI